MARVTHIELLLHQRPVIMFHWIELNIIKEENKVIFAFPCEGLLLYMKAMKRRWLDSCILLLSTQNNCSICLKVK